MILRIFALVNEVKLYIFYQSSKGSAIVLINAQWIVYIVRAIAFEKAQV